MVVMLARTLGIKGYVQNLPNGKVFIIAEGPREDLVRFVKSISIDNSRIMVDDIFIDCKDAQKEFKGFYKMNSKQPIKALPDIAPQSRKGRFVKAKGRYQPASSGLEKVAFETEKVNYTLEKMVRSQEELKEEIESSCDSHSQKWSGRKTRITG